MSSAFVPAAQGVRRGWHLHALWAGQMLSGVGDQLHQIALLWVATGALGARAGWVALAGMGTRLVAGLVGGALADRWDRQRVLLATDAVRAVAVLTLPIAARFGDLQIVHLALVAAVLGAADALFQPALQASLPALTREPAQLQRLNALLNLNHRFALIVGPPLTGTLLAWMSISDLFTVDAATFCLSALAILSLGRGYAWRAESVGPRQNLSEDLGSAARLLSAHRVMSLALPMLFVAAAVWGLASVAFPLLVQQQWGGDVASYGYLMGAYGTGNVASNLAMATFPVTRPARMLALGMLIYGGGLLGIALAPSLHWAFAFAVFASIGGPMMDVVLLGMTQLDFPPSKVGKIVSLQTVVGSSARGVGYVFTPPLIAALGVSTALALGAGLAVLSGFLFVFFFARRTP